MVKNIVLLILMTMTIKIISFIKEGIFANYLGTGIMSDSYLLGIMLSQIILAGIAENSFKAYLPLATEKMLKSEQEYQVYTNNILIFGGISFFLICIFFSYLSNSIIPIFAGKNNNEIIMTSISISKIATLFSIGLYIINICQGYLQIQGKFWSNLFYPLLMNMCTIYYLITFSITRDGLAISYSLGIIFPALILLVVCRIYGLKFFLKNFEIKELKRFFLLSSSLFIGGIVPQLNEIIDKFFSLSYSYGVMTALRYGKLLEIVIVSIIGISIAQVVYPNIAKLISQNKIKDLEKLLSNILNILFIIILPIQVCGILLARDIIEILFMRGKFDETSLQLTTVSYLCYSLSILPVCISEVLIRCYISLNVAKQVILFSSFAMGFNIILNYIGVNLLEIDYYILPLTTSFSEIIVCIFYYTGLKSKKIRLELNKKLIKTAIGSTIILFSILYYSKMLKIEKINLYLLVFLKLSLGLIMYLIILGIFNFEFVKKIIRKEKKGNDF